MTEPPKIEDQIYRWGILVVVMTAFAVFIASMLAVFIAFVRWAL